MEGLDELLPIPELNDSTLTWEHIREAQTKLVRPAWDDPDMKRPMMIVCHAEDFDDLLEATELLGWDALGTIVKMWPAELHPQAEKGKVILIYDPKDVPDGIDPV